MTKRFYSEADSDADTDADTDTDTDADTDVDWDKKFVGNIPSDGAIRSDFLTYWDQITPETEGKWMSIEPVQDEME